MRYYDDPVTDGDDDDAVVHGKSNRLSHKSRSASLTYFDSFVS